MGKKCWKHYIINGNTIHTFVWKENIPKPFKKYFDTGDLGFESHIIGEDGHMRCIDPYKYTYCTDPRIYALIHSEKNNQHNSNSNFQTGEFRYIEPYKHALLDFEEFNQLIPNLIFNGMVQNVYHINTSVRGTVHFFINKELAQKIDDYLNDLADIDIIEHSI